MGSTRSRRPLRQAPLRRRGEGAILPPTSPRSSARRCCSSSTSPRAARSAAATALGFARFDPALPVAAVALESGRFREHTREAARRRSPRSPACRRSAGSRVRLRCALPERHLGLLLAAESDRRAAVLERGGGRGRRIISISTPFSASPVRPRRSRRMRRARAPRRPRNGPVLALARDAAFSFYYEDDLDLLPPKASRARPVQPGRGRSLCRRPPSGVYLGGGYPELLRARTRRQSPLWREIGELHARGAPILAECGGFMALTEALIDGDGARHRWRVSFRASCA